MFSFKFYYSFGKTGGSFEITDLHPTLLANGKIVDFEGIMVWKGTRPCIGIHEFEKDVRKKIRHVHFEEYQK